MTSAFSPLEHPYEPPRTPSERALAEIFAQVLRLERVGIADNFFSLGGNSLTAVKLIKRVRDELGIRLPLWVVFQFACVSDLAGQLDEQCKATATT
jgi:acyl carrier protein